ncbi:MAG TPA: VWA domain-containing protein [Phycisphaerae bacterium]|nr:VWA domain-containing protein [Phycisphaerae bacterium]
MTSLFISEHFDRPAYLWLVLLLVLMWWVSRRSLAGLGPIRGKLCVLVRAAVVVILVLALAGMNKIRKNEDLNVLFLLDLSRSILPETRRQAEEFIVRTAKDMRPNDRAAVLTFDGQTNIEQLPSRPGPDGGIHILPPFADGRKPDRTNVAQGLRMAAACALDSARNRIVLLSDGNQNVGDALDEVKTAAANKISVDVLPLRVAHGADVVNEQLRAPAYANLHEQVPLRLILKSDQRTTGTVLIYQRAGQAEELLHLGEGSEDYGQHVTLEKGRNAFTVLLPITSARAHEWRSVFVPDDPSADVISQNNVARAFTNIEGPQTVLFIDSEADRKEDRLLVDALLTESINVQWETAESINLETSVLQDYSAIVLANVGADYFSAEQQKALATYVRDLGGGLIMIGGGDSFGAGGWQGSVVEDIMPIKFDVDAVKQIPRGALAIVMHSCEMPEGNTWGIRTAEAALQTLSRLDYFGIVDLGGAMGYQWEVPMRTATNKEAITQQIRNMQNSDMGDFQTPMEMAYQALMSCTDAAQRHMIIISDGDPAPPTTGLLNKMVGSKITCSTVSIFPHGGSEIATLRHIANVTGGTYYALSQPGDEKRLPKIFIKEAKIVRRPLIRDETFKPRVMKGLSDIMTGIGGDFPILKGYVVTTPRKVPDVEMPLTTERGDPLFAHWLCGFGRTEAFTSGGWEHWGVEWPSWPSFSKFWSQAVRWCMQQGSAADYDVSTTIEGDKGHIVIECVDDQKGFVDFRRSVGKVVGPDGETANLPIIQTGPGRYEATFRADQMGTYLSNIVIAGPEKERPAVIRTGATIAFSPEFRDVGVNEALLREIADVAQGRVLTLDADSKTVFKHDLPPTISRTPLWDRLLELAAFMFLVDVAVRRIAIDPIKALAATRGYIASLAGRFGAGRRAEAVLSDLKAVREKVRAERTGEGDAGGLPAGEAATRPSAGEPDIVVPDATAKFEADLKPGKPAKDLVGALGGPTAVEAQPSPEQKRAEKKTEPAESTMARLLKAKKRAKEQQEDEQKP